jgi:hypothetical protein
MEALFSSETVTCTKVTGSNIENYILQWVPGLNHKHAGSIFLRSDSTNLLTRDIP